MLISFVTYKAITVMIEKIKWREEKTIKKTRKYNGDIV